MSEQSTERKPGRNVERELYLSLKELIAEIASKHFSTGCESGWGVCLCPLAKQMRKSDALLCKLKRHYRRGKGE